ncbi:unnamed protein product [Cylindrotheca closterium]|uniref:DUF6824 domain-containing protein n=1 Tax=Cylindrotheca closterium TaxID=2856 RepID=A0AAD2JKV8_9STRA|nr:unnamed protein product [Cylindrotheca closterium]
MPQSSVEDIDAPPEKIISEALQSLSLKEREHAYEDIHGVSKPIPETDDLVSTSLDRMAAEIEKIEEKSAYEQAKNLSEDIVTKRETRLGFLRADSFNPKKAADRYVKYFEQRLALFGPEKLVQDVTLDDFDEKTMETLSRGILQILPNRDSRGRAIVVVSAAFFSSSQYTGHDAVLIWGQIFFYMMLSLADDEETQRKGVVLINYSLDARPRNMQLRRKILSCNGKSIQCLPIKLLGVHLCHNSPMVQPILSFIARCNGTAVSVRIRPHEGSHSECQYSLISFGIPIKSFPISIDGGLMLSNHNKWIQKRGLKEKYRANKSLPLGKSIDLPSTTDVLLGRGRPFNFHPGNRLLHEIVETYYDQYNSAPREEKTKISEDVVAIVHRYDGHFLKQDADAGVWVEVSNLEARNKVNHSFRRKREFDLKAAGKKVAVGKEGQEKRLKV